MQEISKALAKFQKEFKGFNLNATGNITKTAKYKYATLDNIANLIKPTMGDCELSFRHTISEVDGNAHMSCVITHSSGENVISIVPFNVDMNGRMQGMQAVGSSITYAKRYSLSMALGLVVDLDDDAAPVSESIHSGNGGGDSTTRADTPYMEKKIPFGDSKGKLIKQCSTDELREYCKMIGAMKATGYALELSTEIKFENTKED